MAYKAALGLPKSASTERLLGLGVYNTRDEVIEAHKTSQIEKLSCTEAGGHILSKLTINPVMESEG